ncbi:hypothetical protein RU94_GL001438 [Enterococcus asini]|nr:hypothetical protein RU94_GL001438 [Enterococcus asini]
MKLFGDILPVSFWKQVSYLPEFFSLNLGSCSIESLKYSSSQSFSQYCFVLIPPNLLLFLIDFLLLYSTISPLVSCLWI